MDNFIQIMIWIYICLKLKLVNLKGWQDPCCVALSHSNSILLPKLQMVFLSVKPQTQISDGLGQNITAHVALSRTADYFINSNLRGQSA